MQINDFLVRKIALLVFALGFFALLMFSSVFEPEQTAIEKITESSVGKEVVVQGIAQNVRFSKNTLFFELNDSAKIRAVKFSPTEQEKLLVSEQSFLEAVGTVKKYRGELEIVVKEVKKIA